MIQSKNAENGVLKIIAAVVSIILTVAGVAIAIGAQNQKLNEACKQQDKLEKKVLEHDTAITEIKTDLKYLIKGVDEIRAEVKNK